MKPVLNGVLQPRRGVLAVLAYPILGIAIGLFVSVSASSAGFTLSVVPDTVAVGPNEDSELSIWISAGTGPVANYDFIVEFDPEVVALTEAVEGSLYVRSGFSTWFAVENVSPGSWEVFDAIMQAGASVEPPGQLARLRFEALAPGATAIRLVSVVVTDATRYPIEAVDQVNGTITVTNPDDDGVDLPHQSGWRLGPPHPNPSTSGTTIVFHRSEESAQIRSRLVVYDVSGRFIRNVESTLTGSRLEFIWDGLDETEKRASSGLYLLMVETPGGSRVRKVHIVR